MRSAIRTAPSTGDELPAALGKEAMVGAGDEAGAVLENYAVARLDHTPMCQHLRPDVAAIVALAHGSVDRIPRPNLHQWTRGPIPHENRRLASQAVNAAVLTSPVRVDRLLERNIRRVVVGNDRAC